ncbi:MAG TPA: hypothetical protein VHO66_07010 [Ruminiclostridium sp.]|nr:hypothetical protein [Ruminiclostridium sp.]
MTEKQRRILLISAAIFAIGAVVTVPLAVYLILYEIDPATHFYYDNARFVYFQNVFLIVITLLMILPIFLKRTSVPDNNAIRSRSIGGFSALLAIALCVSSADSMLQTFRVAKGAGGFITGLAGFIAAIFFFTFAENSFKDKKTDLRVMALLPVVWGVVNLVSTFMNLTQIANISEYLYEVMQMVFAILFLYYNARFVGGVTNGHEISGSFAFGLPCALFGLLTSLPPVIAHLINNTRGSSFNTADAVYLAMTLYIIALLYKLLKSKNNVTEIADMDINQAEK